MPRVSIIISCFNHGKFLPDAVANLDPQNTFYEVIIVNDGSTEKETIEVIDTYRAKNFKVIDQENMGLAAARNTGISCARGEYTMLLDADNYIEPDFLEKAVEIFESDPTVDVVFSDAEYFGTKSGKWVVGEFNLQRLMIANYIDACAMVRKSVFEQLGGYDTKMKDIKSGWEDWEMWLRIGFSGRKFKYIPMVGFWYRTAENSMSGEMNRSFEGRNRLKEYLHNKYPGLLGQQYVTDFVMGRFKKNPFKFVTKLIMIAWFPRYYEKLLKGNKIIKGI